VTAPVWHSYLYSFIIVLLLAMSGCAANPYIGGWKAEQPGSYSGLVLEKDNKCMFAVSGGVDGMGMNCIYSIDGAYVHVSFVEDSTKPGAPVTQNPDHTLERNSMGVESPDIANSANNETLTFNLKYDSTNDSLILVQATHSKGGVVKDILFTGTNGLTLKRKANDLPSLSK